MAQETIREPLSNYDEAWTRLSRAIGMSKDRYKGPAKAKEWGNRIRVCAAGDFHVPFHDRNAVAELILREAGKTDVLVIGGDFGDAYSASIFTKYESVPLRDDARVHCLRAGESRLRVGCEMSVPDLGDLWDELQRGKVYECSLRDPNWHLDGLQEGESVYIDPRGAILETLLHELIHRLKPRWGERAVDRMAKRLFCTLTEAEKTRWWKAYRRIKQPRKPKAVE